VGALYAALNGQRASELSIHREKEMPRHGHITGVEATRLANEKRERLRLLPSEYWKHEIEKPRSPSTARVVKKAPPRLDKSGRRGDVILAPKAELQEHICPR
jgi:hypothetical protein